MRFSLGCSLSTAANCLVWGVAFASWEWPSMCRMERDVVSDSKNINLRAKKEKRWPAVLACGLWQFGETREMDREEVWRTQMERNTSERRG